ncbi:MAG: PilZ domain-containing protein [Acidobacteriota bacterium]|nr:PilZ domain-containing protein [Acidobacteriota bacterium]
MNERRFESRFLCADLVRVEWSSEEGGVKTLRTVEAVLEDISSQGACVQVDERLPPGVAVSISAGDEQVARLFGHVSYCVFRDYGYFVGVRFSDETRWSSGFFEPRHLTSLEALARGRKVD